jgi:O-antigen/teichoic acid export membrane protein
MAPQVVALITGLITAVLVARGLGPNSLGQYALILSVSTFAAILSDLGVGQTAIRYASRAASHGDEKNQFAVLRWAFRVRMLQSLLISAVAFVLAPIVAGALWHENSLSSLIQLSLLVGIFGALAHVPIIYFQSIRRFRMNSIILVAQAVLSFIGIFAIALLHAWRLDLIILVNIFTTALGAVAFLTITPKAAFVESDRLRVPTRSTLRSAFRPPKPVSYETGALESRSISSFAVFMILSSIIVTITLQADVWLMGVFLDTSQIGVYSVATKVTLPLVTLLGAINIALWPRVSSVTSRNAVTTLLRKTFQLTFVAAAGALFYAVTAPLFVPFVFGSQYAAGIFLAQLLCFRYSVAMLVNPIGLIGYNFGFVKAYWKINLLQLVVVVLILVRLLPTLGPVAAALALIVNDVIGATAIGLLVWTKMGRLKKLDTQELRV